MPNCAPGDLAEIIHGPNAGRRCVVESAVPREGNPLPRLGWAWYVAPLQPMVAAITVHGFTAGEVVPPGPTVITFDCDLRPIRDADGTDEVLRRVGKPEPETYAHG
jgi:hypothetical protein